MSEKGAPKMAERKSLMLFAGNAHPDLAAAVSQHLKVPLVKMTVGKFSNGETRVEIHESCRGADAFIIQPTCASDGTYSHNSVNENLMELHVIASALRGSSARRITAVMPIYGYARQDKKDKSRSAITARLVAKHLEADGVDRVITIDLHASQIQGFFDIPVDNLYAEAALVEHMKAAALKESSQQLVVVSPDAGGAKRALRVARKLQLPSAIINKERAKPNEVAGMELVGDVTGKIVLLIDDMADTCGTLVEAVKTVVLHGAICVDMYVVHGVFSSNALERINGCESLRRVVVTDTIPQHVNEKKCPKIEVVDISGLLAEAILRTNREESISALFPPDL